ncbi:MAG: septation protein SpoVG family protein, partial [bacterium]
SMPSRKMSDCSFRDIAHPINNDFLDFIEKIILDEYNRILAEGDTGNTTEEQPYE